jgi:Uma2 family endonuclease
MNTGRGIQVVPPPRPDPDHIDYPDSDGRPMGESPLHILNIGVTLLTLQNYFKADPMVFVAANMFVYYAKGDRWKHLSPDVFVVRGIPKEAKPPRRAYFIWENKPLDFALEVTSQSTRAEDVEDKMDLYQNTLKVPEYFLFDPYGEYLSPPLQGYRLAGGVYVRVPLVAGRLPSQVLGLHLEGHEGLLRLYDPAARAWLPTPQEEHMARLDAEAARFLEEEARKAAEQAAAEAEKSRRAAEAAAAEAEKGRQAAEEEAIRLRREIEELRRRLPDQTGG